MEPCGRETRCPAFEIFLTDANGSHLYIPVSLSSRIPNYLKSTTAVTSPVPKEEKDPAHEDSSLNSKITHSKYPW